MALDQIHLRKLLKIMFLDAAKQQSELRKDIREQLAREAGDGGAGGDFYAPFWADAKSHVFGSGDLYQLVDARIAANGTRANLYPQLRQGFLVWWDQRRRWTNEPFRPGRALKSYFPFPGLDATVKIDSILSVRDGLDAERAVYPYFAPNPELSETAARLGLWMLTQALPTVPTEEFRILDVIHGRTFALDRTPLRGDEETEFRRRYSNLLSQRETLRREYE